MTRNEQLRTNYCPSSAPQEEQFIETPVLVNGVITIVKKFVNDHYSQYDPKAFSLQSISEAGLISELRSASPLPTDNLDTLDNFTSAFQSSPVVDSSQNNSDFISSNVEPS